MIEYPYAVISDIHCHDWSAFSYINEDGVSNRLQSILDAIVEAVHAVDNAGGKDIVLTGDLFHTRGKVKPSVFNPVFDLFKQIGDDGYEVWAIPGNHDLENKHSDEIGNALNPFAAIPNFHLFNQPTQVGDFIFLPWIEDKNEFIKTLDTFTATLETTLFCHIGIDGVLDNVKGKIGKGVLDKGFKYVFAGDYHNHKCLGSGIYSVGALTHNSWSDCGSVAGYLLVTKEGVTQHETKAPRFIDFHSVGSKRVCRGNYIRFSGELDETMAKDRVKAYNAYGALGVLDLSTRPTIVKKDFATEVKVDLGIDKAIESYVNHRYSANAAEVLAEAKRVKDARTSR